MDKPKHTERISKILKYENEVLQISESPGHTIDEIDKIYKERKSGSWYTGEPTDLSEKENASKSIWHYKTDIDDKIATKFSLSEEEIGERNSQGKLYKKTVPIT